MKWKARTPDAMGQTKTKNKFAFWPTRIENFIIIWLEFYYEEKTCKRFPHGAYPGAYYFRWVVTRLYQESKKTPTCTNLPTVEPMFKDGVMTPTRKQFPDFEFTPEPPEPEYELPPVERLGDKIVILPNQDRPVLMPTSQLLHKGWNQDTSTPEEKTGFREVTINWIVFIIMMVILILIGHFIVHIL